MRELNSDARRILNGWPTEQIDSVWLRLRGNVAGRETVYPVQASDALVWIGQHKESPEFATLINQVEQIDLAATGRRHKALPRLLAVVAIKAVASGDAIAATKAVTLVRESLNQARRRKGVHGADALTDMISRHLQSNPDSSNLVLEQHLAEIAKAHPLFHDPEEPFVLDYVPRRGANKSKTLTRLRLQQRICKVRRRLGIPVPKRASAGEKPLGIPTGIKAAEESHQPPLELRGAGLMKPIENV